MAGCQTTPTTGTTGALKDACLAWPYTPYSASEDSPETVLGNRRNNKAKDVYCGVPPVKATE